MLHNGQQLHTVHSQDCPVLDYLCPVTPKSVYLPDEHNFDPVALAVAEHLLKARPLVVAPGLLAVGIHVDNPYTVLLGILLAFADLSLDAGFRLLRSRGIAGVDVSVYHSIILS
ncbi:MAG: hypothetical protein IJ555_08320 [Ruminococcus sp.]|nr:hypothetical protein [Ruminococcus sp.]